MDDILFFGRDMNLSQSKRFLRLNARGFNGFREMSFVFPMRCILIIPELKSWFIASDAAPFPRLVFFISSVSVNSFFGFLKRNDSMRRVVFFESMFSMWVLLVRMYLYVSLILGNVPCF